MTTSVFDRRDIILKLHRLLHRFRKQPIFTGEKGQQIIERYPDLQAVSDWGCLDMKTGESTYGGVMYSQSVKFRDDTGVHLGTDWTR
jgi:hypothetical protein